MTLAREFFGVVSGGNLPPDIRLAIKGMLCRMEGKRLCVTIKEEFRRRSSNQNRYYWGVVVPHVIDMFYDCGEPVTDEEAHESLKRDIGKLERTINGPDGKKKKVLGSTREFGVQRFDQYLEAIRSWAAQYDHQIPLPNETQHNYDLEKELQNEARRHSRRAATQRD